MSSPDLNADDLSFNCHHQVKSASNSAKEQTSDVGTAIKPLLVETGVICFLPPASGSLHRRHLSQLHI
ncbi:unnamed protein product [Linum trigynum]|uniref:Uncharacterized protein n=1 Tax=Linum trigynum TaxID=586398 RepID=A0AAV2FE78_9ROSI